MWISMKDKKPEDCLPASSKAKSIYVITCVAGRKSSIRKQTRSFDADTGRWGWKSYYHCSPTHWMELPNVPEEHHD